MGNRQDASLSTKRLCRLKLLVVCGRLLSRRGLVAQSTSSIKRSGCLRNLSSTKRRGRLKVLGLFGTLSTKKPLSFPSVFIIVQTVLSSKWPCCPRGLKVSKRFSGIGFPEVYNFTSLLVSLREGWLQFFFVYYSCVSGQQKSSNGTVVHFHSKLRLWKVHSKFNPLFTCPPCFHSYP